MVSIYKYFLFALSSLLVLSACGGGDGGGSDENGDVDPVVLDLVVAFFTNNGADWNDYLAGNNFASATDTACDTGNDPVCIHGGEIRVVEATGKTSCIGLAASDDLGAFNWVCDASTGTARMISTGLAHGANLSDLIDFTTPGFMSNRVTVFDDGAVWGETPVSTWWNNAVEIAAPGLLGDASTIYLLDASATGTVFIDADKVSLVIRPGVTLSGPGGVPGPIAVIQASGRDYLWLEGSVKGVTADNVIRLFNVNYSSLRGVSVSSGDFLGGGASGVSLTNASNNILSGVRASDSGSGVVLDNASNNTLSGITATSNNSGVFLTNASNDNKLQDLTVSNNEIGAYLLSASHNTLSGVTAANNEVGVYLIDSANNNTLSGLATVNSILGVYLTNASEGNTLAAVTATDGDFGVYLDNTSSNIFTGPLKLGSNVTNCLVTGGTAPGLVDDTCANDPLSGSDAVLTTGNSLANSFVGKLTADDARNSSDTDGSAEVSAVAPDFDWLNFDNDYRGWGLDGSDFPNSDHRDAWIEVRGSGRIWDWSVAAADTGSNLALDEASQPVCATPPCPALLGALDVPGGGDVLSHTWSDSSTTVYLRNAVELSGDGVGNDNTLCESDEACLYTPNIGSYQGHGSLVSAGPFTSGNLTGITLFQFADNGR